MFLVQSHHVRVRGSSVRNNGNRGIIVIDSTDNLIKGNRTSRNKGAGTRLDGANRNQVRRNHSGRDGDGIVLYGNRNVIARNRIAHAHHIHILSDGLAIEVPAGDHNMIARNRVRGTTGDAIGLGFDEGVGNVVRHNHILGAGENGVHVAWGPKKGATRGNVVRRNRIFGAGADGVHVDNKAKQTHLGHNHAFDAKDDGLDADEATTTVTENTANRNHDLGIEAVRGVIDGGGNKASGNGDLRQCTNIVCR
jgi:large repetitive protein